ncbi:MAG: helix-turn-helix transcriptional regulator, partial [Candidatus Omnitrophica bacterium]|nr:helix-turn-helix transcriptional regulator [Candidatus Omnitrophota bacterium]
ANRIKIIRKQKGISQKVLAGKLKVSQQVISRVESGRENVSLSTLKKVADGLGAKLSVDIS